MKKTLSILAIIFFLVVHVAVLQADVTVNAPDIGKTSQGGSFIINAYSANASGCEQLKAAPGSGTAIYIRNMSISSATPVTVTIGEGETTPGEVDTTLMGPFKFGTTPHQMQWDFYPAMKLTNNKSLVMDSDATGDIVVVIQGFIE
ncbi:MAG: hypothetical protein ACYDHW_10805 [Syntrophorhabdaceae bacterium]